MSALKAPTDCVLYARALHAYVDGELSADHTAELEAHVAKCASCFDQVEHHRAVRLSLRRTSTAAASSSLRERMATLVAVEATRPPSAHAPAPEGPPRDTLKMIPLRHVMALAVAAGVVFAVGVSRVRQVEADLKPLPSASAAALPVSFDDFVDDLVAMHASPPPPETTNPEELARFDTYVGVPVRRPAEPTFQPLGVKYDGARMHFARGRRAAVLYYSMQNGHRATVYVFDPSTLPLQRTHLKPRVVKHRPVYVGNVRGYSFAATESSGVGYALASDLDPDLSAKLVASVQYQ